MEATITLIVNGTKKTVVTDPQRSLLDVLREDLHITGPKYGCGEGRCGACTVLMNGKRTLSCTTPVSMANKKKITTIEGLAEGNSLHQLQQAFLDEGAIQCGYCTPGMILTAAALLNENPNPTDEQITEWMNTNICRCNGYTKILNAIHRAAAQIAEVKLP
ncbi:MAG: (2Fe-2S)-binding protein [Planctomycetota bacterium]|jgi:aerobic-type carbon monoxide dehydrogenase small subunit (CoxS/CutS family)